MYAFTNQIKDNLKYSIEYSTIKKQFKDYLNIQTRNFINEHFSFQFAKLKTFTKIATIKIKKFLNTNFKISNVLNFSKRKTNL